MPRRILPGRTYLITRRCRQRTFLLRPCPDTNEILRFTSAHASTRTGVVVHARACMSTHTHEVVTDVEGRLPEYMHGSNLNASRCLNTRFGESENLWAAGRPNVVELHDPERILDAIVYTLGNPVTAGLVARSADWPGVISSPEDWLAGPEVIGRPDVFFRPKGSVPDHVTVQLTAPPTSDGGEHDATKRLVREVRARLTALEDEVAERLKTEGRSPLGSAAVLGASRHERARSTEKFGTLVPNLAAASAGIRVAAIAARKAFIDAYRVARASWLSTTKAVVFPEGTWQLRCDPRAIVTGAIYALPPPALIAA